MNGMLNIIIIFSFIIIITDQRVYILTDRIVKLVIKMSNKSLRKVCLYFGVISGAEWLIIIAAFLGRYLLQFIWEILLRPAKILDNSKAGAKLKKMKLKPSWFAALYIIQIVIMTFSVRSSNNVLQTTLPLLLKYNFFIMNLKLAYS